MLTKRDIEDIENSIGYSFCDKQLLQQAFTRSSYHYEHPEIRDNEVLEFVGDSVLSLSVVNILCDRYTERNGSGMYASKDQGELSAIRSDLVNKQYLAQQVSDLGLQYYLMMSIGDKLQNFENSQSVLEDLFESIVGAIYIDTNKDLKKTQKVVSKLLGIQNFLDQNNGNIHISYKNDLQELCQKYSYNLPRYNTSCTNGKDFICVCIVQDGDFYREVSGTGSNKKYAESNAAKAMLELLSDCFIPSDDKKIVNLDNAINVLQEYCQRKDVVKPYYETISDTRNADNSHTFIVRCHMDKCTIDGEGATVKGAKKQAALSMLAYLGVMEDDYE